MKYNRVSGRVLREMWQFSSHVTETSCPEIQDPQHEVTLQGSIPNQRDDQVIMHPVGHDAENITKCVCFRSNLP